MRAAPSNLPQAGDWWQLPSGRVVSVRRIVQADQSDHTECIVRYVDEHGGMAQGEFSLTVGFIARGRKVGHD